MLLLPQNRVMLSINLADIMAYDAHVSVQLRQKKPVFRKDDDNDDDNDNNDDGLLSFRVVVVDSQM
jgi:hypothetical protein